MAEHVSRETTDGADPAMSRPTADDHAEYLDVPGGHIAYEVTGKGPLVVLSPGIGDLRQSYRFLAPKLAQAGYRVASADMRGHGDSSIGWTSISRTDVAGDLVALIRPSEDRRSSSVNPCQEALPLLRRRRPRNW